MGKLEIKEIKKILELTSIFDNRIAGVVQSCEEEERKISVALKKLLDREISRRLLSLDIDTVNRNKLGIRVSALREAGIENMNQLCSMSYKELTRLKGIGEESAYLIYTVAGKIKQQISSDVKVKISVNDRDENASELLCLIRDSKINSDLISEAKKIHEKYSVKISELYAQARGLSSFFGRMFSSNAKRELAHSSANELYSLLSGEYGNRCQTLLKAWDERTKSTAEDAWSDFERNSASYYAKLEQLEVQSGARIDNSYSGIPMELVREIEQQKISLTGLKATLRTYQDFGVKYIVRQGNVLLGDEMGLGKTVQAIAAMVSLRAAGESHFMVVCPASVLVNWAREIKQFSDLNVVSIQGGDIAAVRKWREEGGVAVTTYGSISRFSLPEDFRFGMLVADEAHYIKNPMAQRTQALLILKRRAKKCLFMTGTPLENHVDEMCFIIKCLRPDIAEEVEDMAYFSSASKFREKLAPVYLRRTREDVLTELPALVEKEQWCTMGAAEWESYLLSVMSENFMAMRQVSWDIADINKSSKAKRLLQLCDMAAEEGRKVIVFSYFLDTIYAVKELLGERAIGPITGSVSPARRQKIVDDFGIAANGTVLLCQVQAGGTGLNIQAASVVIFCEPQIKPSIESQAISRAYRMGQIRTVIVHRLLCENTVDERIMELLREKQDVFDSFAHESSTGSEYMKGEKSIAAAVIAAEKERLHQQPESFDEEEDDE